MSRSLLIVTGIVNGVFGLVETLLGLRVVLKLFGANSATPFIAWLYQTTEPLLAPFAGMFQTPIVDQGLVLEFTTLFALIIFELLRFLLNELAEWTAAVSERHIHTIIPSENAHGHKHTDIVHEEP